MENFTIKRIFIVLTIILMVVISVVYLTPNIGSSEGGPVKHEIRVVNGHEYLITYNVGAGVDVLHLASCRNPDHWPSLKKKSEL